MASRRRPVGVGAVQQKKELQVGRLLHKILFYIIF